MRGERFVRITPIASVHEQFCPDRESSVTDESVTIHDFAGLAHLVEQLICNHQVAGSSPAAGTNQFKGPRDFHVAL